MLKPLIITAVLSVSAVPAFAQQCLHGPGETPADRARREKAVDVAHQINALEMTSAPGLRGPRFKRPDEIKLPSPPDGFGFTFLTDGRSYTFSLKDERDPCAFAIFSDQDGLVYATHPAPGAAKVVPLHAR